MKVADHDVGRLALARELDMQTVALRLDLPPSTLSAIANRRVRPRLRTVHALADLFGVELGEVLGAVLEPLPEVARRKPRRNKRMPEPIDLVRWLSMPQSAAHRKGTEVLRLLGQDVLAEVARRAEAERIRREQEQCTGLAPVGAGPEHSEVIL